MTGADGEPGRAAQTPQTKAAPSLPPTEQASLEDLIAL